MSYGYRRDLDPSSLATAVVVEAVLLFGSTRDLHSLHTLLLLAMITCFMSNQICRVGGSLCFFVLIHMRYFFIGLDYSSILPCFVVTEQCAFGICTYSLFSRYQALLSLPLADWRAWVRGYPMAEWSLLTFQNIHIHYS